MGTAQPGFRRRASGCGVWLDHGEGSRLHAAALRTEASPRQAPTQLSAALIMESAFHSPSSGHRSPRLPRGRDTGPPVHPEGPAPGRAAPLFPDIMTSLPESSAPELLRQPCFRHMLPAILRQPRCLKGPERRGPPQGVHGKPV